MNQPLPISAINVTAVATAVTWLPYLDIYLRIGASLVAIISGLLVATVAIRTLRKK